MICTINTQKVKDSPSSVNSSYDILVNPPTNTSSLEGFDSEFSPTSSIDNNNPIEIVIPAIDKYIDLSKTRLKCKYIIKKANGNVLPKAKDCKVWVGDMNLASLFNSLEIRAGNGNQVVEQINHYPYKAFFEMILSSTPESRKNKYSKLDGMIEDDLTGENGSNHATASAEALLLRQGLIEESKGLEYCGRLHSAFFNQDRYLIPKTKLTLVLKRSNSNFVLSAADNNPTDGCQIQIQQISIIVRSILPHPQISKLHSSYMVAGKFVKYPFKRGRILNYTISPGKLNTTVRIQDSGILPTQIFLGIVDHEALNGHFEKNPFIFEHSNVTKVQLILGGNQVGIPFEPDYKNNFYAREYSELLSVINQLGTNDYPFSHSQFVKSKTIYAFDLTADRSNSLHLTKSNSCEFQLTFSEATAKTLNVILYTIEPDIIQFNVDRKFTYTSSI